MGRMLAESKTRRARATGRRGGRSSRRRALAVLPEGRRPRFPRRAGRSHLGRHAPGRPSSGLRVSGRGDPEPRRPAEGCGPVRERLRPRAADAARRTRRCSPGFCPRRTACATTWGTRSRAARRPWRRYLKAKGYATGGAVSSIVLSHVTGSRAGLRFLRGHRRAGRSQPDALAGPAPRRRDGGPADRLDRPPRRPAVLRVPAPLRAAHALRAAGALRQPVQAGLRRGDRARRRDRRRLSPKYLKDQEHLRPRAHRLSVGSRRRA